MVLQGHKIYKMSKEYVFDATEFIGYKVILKDDTPINFVEAFRFKKNDNDEFNVNYKIDGVPFGVVRESIRKVKHLQNLEREAYE